MRQAVDEIVVDTRGGVQAISIPQPSPLEGLLATKLVFRTVDPDHRLITVEGLAFRGDVHQVWLEGPFGTSTAFLPRAGPTYHESWIPADSHLLFDPYACVGCGSGSRVSFSETNDGATTDRFAALLPQLEFGFGPLAGFGDMAFSSPNDAFFVRPEQQTNEHEFAYLITTAATDNSSAGEVTLSIGWLGLGIVDSGIPGGARWGLDGDAALPIPFAVAEPGSWGLLFAAAVGILLRRMPPNRGKNALPPR